MFICIVFLNSCGLHSAYIKDNISRKPVEELAKEEIENTIFLIGDAGETKYDYKEPVFIALEKEASLCPYKNLIIFLGDNVYPYGMPDKSHRDRRISEYYLNQQINIIKNSGASGIFIPGNHDWEKGNKNGWRYLINQEEYIISSNIPNLQFLPKGGCPGPEVIDFGEKIRIIIIDTQWWLHNEIKPKYNSLGCENSNESEIINALKTAMDNSKGRYIIVAGHHPFESNGEHGGYFNWKDHIFPLRKLCSWMWIPLPIIGSSYPLLRNSIQDLSSSEYQNMKTSIEQAFEKNIPLAYVSGHEHSLQVLQTEKGYLQLVSGNGITSHNNFLTYDDNTLFADPNVGFMRVDFLKNGYVRLSVFESVNLRGDIEEVFSMWLIK